MEAIVISQPSPLLPGFGFARQHRRGPMEAIEAIHPLTSDHGVSLRAGERID
jgi:hypothetical protein